MPVNNKTGKTDRHILDAAAILEFRVKQLNSRLKGKQLPVIRGRNRNQDSSNSGNSPQTMIQDLTLESARKSGPSGAYSRAATS